MKQNIMFECGKFSRNYITVTVVTRWKASYIFLIKLLRSEVAIDRRLTCFAN